MEEKKGLLDDIRERSGYLYISDLRKASVAKDVQQAVAQIDREQYSPDEWREAYDYITGDKFDKDIE